MSDFTILPPGLSTGDFRRAIAELTRSVGDESVVIEPERLAPYRRLQVPAKEEQHAPSAAVLASSVEDVQATLAVCNTYKIPVWTISTGRNLGYGSAAPASRGQMILDLRRMNRILEVDPELCYAVVEPGVTYPELQKYLADRNIPLWLSFPGSGVIAGPLGNSLDRGVGYNEYGDNWGSVCGLEVVLADGEVLRTGMGGMAGSTSWHVYKYGFGPVLDGLFSQSNLGVVTKMGIWLMPAPPAHRTINAKFWDPRKLGVAIETARHLKLTNVVTCTAGVADVALAMIGLAKRADIYSGSGAAPAEAYYDYAKKTFNLSPVLYNFTLYGTEEQVALNQRIATEALERAGAEVDLDAVNPLQTNTLTYDDFRAYNFVGGGGSCWLSPVCPARGADATRQTVLARDILNRHGMDYNGGFTVFGRDMHHVAAILYDRGEPGALERIDACYRDLIAGFAQAGYGMYRTSPAYMGLVADTYGPVKKRVNQTLKRALDPNGILAPGKSGMVV